MLCTLVSLLLNKNVALLWSYYTLSCSQTRKQVGQNKYFCSCRLSFHSSTPFLVFTPRVWVHIASWVCFLRHSCFFLVIILVATSPGVAALAVRWACWLRMNHNKIYINTSLQVAAVARVSQKSCKIQPAVWELQSIRNILGDILSGIAGSAETF